jgi:hypothetical protein
MKKKSEEILSNKPKSSKKVKKEFVHEEFFSLITFDQLAGAFLDLLDGIYEFQDIQHFTGLSEERCKNILNIRNNLKNNSK